LSVIQHDEQGLAFVLGQIAGEFIEVAFAPKAGAFAQAAGQTGQQPTAAQSGLSQIDWGIETAVQLPDPTAY
jgi:hypothetical protein